MAQAAESDRSFSLLLGELKNATNKDQCRRVKLISYFLGLNWSDVDIEKRGVCIPEIFRLLQLHPSLGSKAVAILQTLLHMVGVESEVVKKLGSSKDQLEECKQLPRFAFAEMIVTVILGLGDEHFKALREFFVGEKCLGTICPANIVTPEDLFRRLYQAEKVYPGDITLLVKVLNEIQLIDAARMVQDYQDQHGHRGKSGQLLTRQTNCLTESGQHPIEKSQAVYPQMKRMPHAIGSQYHRSDSTSGGVSPNHSQLSSNMSANFSKLAEDDHDRDGVATDDTAKKTQEETTPHLQIPPPSVTDQVNQVHNTSINRHINDQTSTETTVLGPNRDPNKTELDVKTNKSSISGCFSNCSTSERICSTLGLLLLLLAILAGIGDLALYLFNAHQLRSQTVLAHANNTVIIGKVTGSFVKSVSVSEHLEEDDYTQISHLFVASSLKLHKRELEGKQPLQYQASPEQFTGLLDYIYLLRGSVINYTICLASVTNSNEDLSGNFYIFDNVTSYRLYDTDHAVYHKVLEFGTNNNTCCWSLSSWIVNKAAYYFLMSETPGNIVYKYQYNIEQFYLDPDDYDEAVKECPQGIYDPVSCVLHVHHGDYVIGFVEPPVADDPMTTHLELRPMRSSVVMTAMIVALCVFVCGVVLVVGVFCSCVVKRYGWHRSRCGYESL